MMRMARIIGILPMILTSIVTSSMPEPGPNDEAEPISKRNIHQRNLSSAYYRSDSDRYRKGTYRYDSEDYCEDTRGIFQIENARNVLTMACSDLGRSVFRFGCTWSLVREKVSDCYPFLNDHCDYAKATPSTILTTRDHQCPKTCDSCPNFYHSSNDYESEYVVGDDYGEYFEDKNSVHSNLYRDPYGDDEDQPEGGTTGTCRDAKKEFRLNTGEFITCPALKTSTHADRCKWRRIKMLCPVTCGMPCANAPQPEAQHQTSEGQHISNNEDVKARGGDGDNDDFYDVNSGNNEVGKIEVCKDVTESFQLRPSGGSEIHCQLLRSDQYSFACLLQRIKNLW